MRKPLTLFLSLALSACLLSACTSQTDELINRQTDILVTDPNNVTALTLRAEGFRDKQEHQKALADLNKALEVNGDSTRALTLRGEVQMRLKNYDAAIADFNAALERNPDLSTAYALRGQSRIESQQNYAQALEDLDTAVKKGENTAEVQRFRGQALVRLERRTEAIAAYTLALEKLQAPPPRGEERARGREMVSIAAEALEQSGANAKFYVARGQGYHLQREFREAIDDFTEALRLDARLAEAYQKRADSFNATGRCDEAINDLKSACRLSGSTSICDTLTLECNQPTVSEGDAEADISAG